MYNNSGFSFYKFLFSGGWLKKLTMFPIIPDLEGNKYFLNSITQPLIGVEGKQEVGCSTFPCNHSNKDLLKETYQWLEKNSEKFVFSA